MENRPRKKLSRKMIGICSGFALILSAVLGSLGFYTYYHNIMDQYQQYIETIISISRSYIDADDMTECIETGEKSARYEETQKFLDNIKNHSQVEFIYVIKPLNDGAVDNAMYVWNAVEEGEVEEFGVIDSLGDLSGEGFPEDMAGHFLGAMDGGEEVTYISNRSEEFGYVLTGLYPVLDSQGQAQALIGVDILMDKIYTDLQQYLIFVVAGTLIVGALFLILFLRQLNKSVIAPVARMAESAEDFVQQSGKKLDPSELHFRDPQVHTGDEVELLSENLNQMTAELVEYMGNLKQVTADRERIGAELSVATSIQSSMLPRIFPAFPERTEFDIYAELKVAREMGGSFYDLFLVDENHLAVVMGEIAGKGIPAALLMVITKTLIKNYAQMGYSPAKVFSETNNQLSESNEGMTTTAFLGVVDLTDGKFEYVNAAHCTPLLKHAGGEFAALPAKDCFVLGSMAGVPYWQQSVRLVQGDLLFLYTKGLPEAENASGVQYSEDHMQMRLNQALGEAYELPDIVRLMQQDVETFLGGAVRQQDIAMLLLRYFGK